jgi:hypothetical protein
MIRTGAHGTPCDLAQDDLVLLWTTSSCAVTTALRRPWGSISEQAASFGRGGESHRFLRCTDGDDG